MTTLRKKIILTGELHIGKSTLVRTILHDLRVSHCGVFCEPVSEEGQQVGYALRVAGETKLDVFAHKNRGGETSLGVFKCDLKPFERAALYLSNCLTMQPPLVVIDEIGVIEKKARAYHLAVQKLLDSPLVVLLVVQKRADYMWKVIDGRRDCQVYKVTPDNRAQLPGAIVENVQALLARNKNGRRSRRSG